MENVTPAQFSAFLFVLFTIFAALLTLDKIIDLVKKWKSPGLNIEKKLASDKAQLDEHDTSIRELRDSSRIQCAALMALLDHELHDGNTGQMEEARNGLMKYLTNK